MNSAIKKYYIIYSLVMFVSKASTNPIGQETPPISIVTVVSDIPVSGTNPISLTTM